MGDDPPYLTVGTEVSAKYKGAFCEAKIRKVVRVVKCKVTFKAGLGSALLSDDQIRGTLRVGVNVEAKHHEKNNFCEATINKIQDCSQYTVVFDDGDITTLRRSALCLKSGRHFNESETLDQLPLTHPEHFSNPVVGGRRGVRRRAVNSNPEKEDSSDEEDSPSQKGKNKPNHEVDLGVVVCVKVTDKKKAKDNWFPALVVSPSAQETVKIRVKDEYLVRSFKDGRYYTVPKKEITVFIKEQHGKDSISTALKSAVDMALSYVEKDTLPPLWDRDVIFGNQEDIGSDDDVSDTESMEEKVREKKDTFVAQLYKLMEERSTPINKVPVICNKELDLYKLSNIVSEKGGYGKVTQWKPVTIKLGLGAMPSTSTINLVKQAYKKLLLPFEDFRRKLGCTVQFSSSSKARNSRSVYRGGSATVAKEAKKKEEESAELPKVAEDIKTPAPPADEIDTASIDSDSKKSEEEPRRSRSRQDVKKDVKKDASDEEKVSEKPTKKKRATKEKEKEPVVAKEEPATMKAEPPSPAPSSQGSKKGRGSRKRKEVPKVDEPPAKEEFEAPAVEIVQKEANILLGEKLLVLYPKGGKELTYEAKVIDINEKHGTFLVHYNGWNNRYDEWIKRDRIAENVSHRPDYQTKAQGKGPSSSNVGQGNNEANSESSGSTSSKGLSGKTPKKKGRITPSVPTSLTGTRSKTGTIKRKRMSADFEEPLKKKRNSKKLDKDVQPSDSDSEASDSEVKVPRTLAPSPDVSTGATPVSTPQKSKSAALKEKKLLEKEKAQLSTGKKDTPTTEVETVEKEKKNQVIDLNQIRSEMKGLDKIVKSKASTSNTPTPGTSASQVPTPLPSLAATGQKLDIYEFEEDMDTPKLKMFSPRSPDKKEEPSTKSLEIPVIPALASIKPVTEPIIAVADASAVSKVGLSAAVTPIVTVKTESSPIIPTSPVIKPIQATGTIVATSGQSLPPVPPAPSAKVLPALPSVLTVPSPRPQLVPSPTVIPPSKSHAGQLKSDPKVRLLVTSSSPPRLRSPPLPFVSTSSAVPRPLTPTPHGLLAQSSPPGSSPPLPVLITRPVTSAVSPQLTPLPQVILTPGGNLSGILATKDPKVLPFVPRKQELFPHLVQQHIPGSSITLTPDLKPDSAAGKPSISKPKDTTDLSSEIPSSSIVIPKKVLDLGIHPPSNLPSSPDIPAPKKEKGKRGPSKKTPKKLSQNPPDDMLLSPKSSPGKKRAKLDTPKGKASPGFKGEKHPSSSESLNKINDTITNVLMMNAAKHGVITPPKEPSSAVTSTVPKAEKPPSVKKNKQGMGPTLGKDTEKKLSSIKTNLLLQTPPQTGIVIPPPEAGGSGAKDLSLQRMFPGSIHLNEATGEFSRFEPKPSFIPSTTASSLLGFSPTLKITKPTTTDAISISSSTAGLPLLSIPRIESNLSNPVLILPKASPLIVPQEDKSKSMGSSAGKDKSVLIVTTDLSKPSRGLGNLPVLSVVKPTPTLTLEAIITSSLDGPRTKDMFKEGNRNEESKKVSGKESERPLTPSFLTAREEFEPEGDDFMDSSPIKGLFQKLSDEKSKTSLSSGNVSLSKKPEEFKEEESCSSLLCEEEIPGSPTPEDENDKKGRFDFREVCSKVDTDKEDKASDRSKGRGQSSSGQDTRTKDSASKDKLGDLGAAVMKEKSHFETRYNSSALAENTTPPSTPDSNSFSTETGGSPHVDGGRVSPSGEAGSHGSNKSKESTDGDSGDGSKAYYSEGDSTRKSGNNFERPHSPVSKRSRESRGRNSSPPPKRKRMSRRKSPEEAIRPFVYRGGRISSGRKPQVEAEREREVVKPVPPPAPVNLGKPPKSAKFNFIPDLDEVSDSEQRISLIMQAITSVREKYGEVKAKQQAIEKRQKRRKRKERERTRKLRANQ